MEKEGLVESLEEIKESQEGIKESQEGIKEGNYLGNNPKLLIMSLRAKMIRDWLKSETPDIVCFQEMSIFFFNFLYTDELDQIYPYFYEKDIQINFNTDYKVMAGKYGLSFGTKQLKKDIRFLKSIKNK